MQYVYITKQCRKDTKKIGMLKVVEELRDRLFNEQNTQGLDRFPAPFLKKRLGTTRLIIIERHIGDDVVIIFLKHVYRRDIDDYKVFLEKQKQKLPDTDTPEIAEFLAQARKKKQNPKKEPASDLELAYLQPTHDTWTVNVLESPLWVEQIKHFRETPGKQGLLTPIHELVVDICEGDEQVSDSETSKKHPRQAVRVHYRKYAESGQLFLVAPVEVGKASDENLEGRINTLLDESQTYSEEDLLRNSARAYPNLVVYDRETWEQTQTSTEANLALSPEESDVLASVMDPQQDGGFPLFINGRPGSGKSTILQYLFAEHLHAHLVRDESEKLNYPPLYLTYNERLLSSARGLVRKIFECGAKTAVSSRDVDLNDPVLKAQFDLAFESLRDFLLSRVDPKSFDENKHVDFLKFRKMYQKRFLRDPDARLRTLAAEVAWHVIRTYIKGKSAARTDYFDSDSYQELPRDEVTVSPDIFALVWEKVWNGWYRHLCENQLHWDDQDLTREVLDKNLVPSEFPGVFCDESQDFTSIELELIFRLSRFVTKQVEPYLLKNIPYVFAGDPFQTLNPTGFRWDATKANFHDNIVRQLDPDKRGNLNICFKELTFNYRSTSNIVRFCNLIQLQRAQLFDIDGVKPQKTWSGGDGGWPAYFDIDSVGAQGQLADEDELMIVVPCQEGGEKEFILKDDFLKNIALDKNGEPSRYVYSPMMAKGLEFGRVVLYKFGQTAVDEHLEEVIEKINSNGFSSMGREHTLELEYFLNGTYVAASRAQKRLFIADTEEGIKSFWRFATSTDSFDQLLTAKRREHWDDNDLRHMMLGDEDAWDEDRDDPAVTAEKVFNKGVTESDPWSLKMAQVSFIKLGNKRKALTCEALISELDEDFESAAASYEKLTDYSSAMRCYWQSGSYEACHKLSLKDVGKFVTEPIAIGAKFLTEEQSPKSALKAIKGLAASSTKLKKEQLKLGDWSRFSKLVVETIVRADNDSGEIDTEGFESVVRILDELSKGYGFEVESSYPLSELAYRAGDPARALEIWDQLKRGKRKKVPEFVLRARAEISEYPECLEHYKDLDDMAAILDGFANNADIELDRSDSEIVLNALVTEDRYSAAAEFAKTQGSFYTMDWVLQNLPDNAEGTATVKSLIVDWVRSGFDVDEFRRVIDVTTRNKEPTVKVVEKLLGDKDVEQILLALKIKLLARSVTLHDNRTDKKYVSGKVFNATKNPSKALREFVTPEEVGAALERAGRLEYALRFYESVYKHKKWGNNRGIVTEARARWLKCKDLQSQVVNADSRTVSRRKSELKARSAEWGILIPEERFPHLGEAGLEPISKALGSEQKEGLVKPPKVDPKPKEPKAETKPEATDSPVEETNPVANGELAVVATEPEVESELLESGVNLTKRKVAKGRVDMAFSIDSLALKAKLLGTKRRVEIRNPENDDLVMIHAKRNSVESDDLEISGIENGGFKIDAWSLEVNLVNAVDEMCLVDLLDDSGARILCFVL